jgi:hypothetical protein
MATKFAWRPWGGLGVVGFKRVNFVRHFTASVEGDYVVRNHR